MEDRLHIPPGEPKPICVVCEEATDGQHFGQFTCRACAAFFRRTVAQNLKYVCKFDQQCEISKDVRNFCRYCRYQKCLGKGMITDAVQSHRDTYGKRNLPSLDDTSPKPSKDSHHHNTSNSSMDNSSHKSITSFQGLTGNTSTTSFSLFPDHKSFPSMEAIHLPSHSSAFHPPTIMKRLPRMVEGYLKFRSLRKASYSLFMDEPRFVGPEGIPESTYSNNKKSCQVESSLAYDMIMEYFEPYSELPLDDRNKLFENFQGLLSCGEKGYNTCRAYTPGKPFDRLIMTDGGYIKLEELSKYYANSTEVNGNPEEVARFFGTSISYAVKTVVPAMVRADIDDHIMVGLYGLCLFQEGVCGISEGTKEIVVDVRDEILKDMYHYYRSKGLKDADLNFKMAKALLLIPKFEHITRLVRENFRVADLFSLCEVPKAYK